MPGPHAHVSLGSRVSQKIPGAVELVAVNPERGLALRRSTSPSQPVQHVEAESISHEGVYEKDLVCPKVFILDIFCFPSFLVTVLHVY